MNAPEAVALACRALLGREATLAKVLSRAPGSDVVRASLADGDSVIVKLHTGAQRRRAREQQRALAAVAAYTTVPTPRVLGCGGVPGTGASALIAVDLGQVDLGRAVRDGLCTRDQALEILSGLLARLHRLPMAAGPRPATGSGPRIDALALIERCPGPLAETVAPLLIRAAARARTAMPTVWCHGDLHPANVLFPQDGAGRLGPAHVIDFEQMVHAAPEYDVAQCLVTSDALAPSERARVAASYGSPLDQRLLDELIVFHAVRGLVYAAMAERRDASLWNRRVTCALERSLALGLTTCEFKGGIKLWMS